LRGAYDSLQTLISCLTLIGTGPRKAVSLTVRVTLPIVSTFEDHYLGLLHCESYDHYDLLSDLLIRPIPFSISLAKWESSSSDPSTLGL
jgi:hypothetical protein